jgi:hypothetical protein
VRRRMTRDQCRISFGVEAVGLLVHREEGECALIVNPVETFEAGNLRRRDLGNLRFVNVERGDTRRDWPL